MNSKRYFSDLSYFINVEEIENNFTMDLPFDIHSGQNHLIFVK